MNLTLPSNLADSYSNLSQKIRVITENWVYQSIFCPNCGNSLSQFENNHPAGDFSCSICSEEYELKSKKGFLGKKIVDGEYNTMIKRLQSENNPNFFFLTYDKKNFEVIDFLTIPNYFFTETIIEKRKPLSLTAKRAGWTGCNIQINHIPEFGKIFFIQNKCIFKKEQVLKQWKKTRFIKNTNDIQAKGWLLDILLCIEKLKKNEFSLKEIYLYENFLKTKHPSNHNIQAKIRQQLQLLRNRNYLEFNGNGKYKVL